MQIYTGKDDHLVLASKRDVILSPLPFKASEIMKVSQGSSVLDIITQMYDEGHVPSIRRDYNVVAQVDGNVVPREEWVTTVPAVNQHVLICQKIHGGGDGAKDALRIVMIIALIVVSIAIPGSGLPLLGIAGMGLTGTSAAVMTMAMMTAGMLLINAVAPVRAKSVDSETTATSSAAENNIYSISGASNTADPFGPIPVILGKHRVYAKYGSGPYTEIIGNDEYLRLLFIWGYGPLKLEELKIGDTLLSAYTDYEVQNFEGWSTDADPSLIPSQVFQDSIGIELSYNTNVTRTPHPYVDEISVDISFSNGLCAYNSDGSREARGCSIQIDYREIGGGWATVYTFVANANSTSALRYGYKWSVSRTKAYEVRLTRTTIKHNTTNIIDDATWVNLRGTLNDPPVSFPYPIAMTALRIKATEQLNSVIDTFNAVCTSYAPTWDGNAWTTAWSATQNNAALFRLVLMHNANARRRVASQINDDVLGEWYEFCTANGFQFNQVRETKTSVWDCLADIAAAGRASNSLADGVWGVAVDTGTHIVKQHVTPRNSWGFEASKKMYVRPHAFRVRFNNEDEGYEEDERIVYDDGYDATNATVFESIEFPGITDPDLIWKLGRFHIAQAPLRTESYSLYMDVEKLTFRRGSKIVVSHDVPLWGGGYGRVKRLIVSGSDTTGVMLDSSVLMESGINYVCRFRLVDETSLVLNVTRVVGESDTLTFSTAVATASGPQVGDLFMFGELNNETADCLVTSIERAENLTARISFVDHSPDIYTADTGAIPEFETHVTRPLNVASISPAAPSIVNIQSDTKCLAILNSAIKSRIFVSLSYLSGTLKIGDLIVRYRRSTVTTDMWIYVHATPDNPTAILTEVVDAETYEIQAQCISIYGMPSAWSASSYHTCIGQSEDPSDITEFAVNIVGDVANLSWTPIDDIDCKYYKVRWSPLLSGALWGSSVDAVSQVGRNSSSASCPAMVGSYLIKAFDHSGHESENACVAITNVTDIAGLNFVDSLIQPPFSGTGNNVVYIPEYDTLVLCGSSDIYDATDIYAVTELYTYGGLETEGTYTFDDDDDLIDLGGIYTSRVTASLYASGVNLLLDLYTITDLYEVDNLYGASEGQYSASLEMRFTSDNPSGSPAWSDWIPFLVGDYTARAFQFRLRLTSVASGVTPCVSLVTATVDMPDRTVRFNATVPVAGYHVTFNPAFYHVPEVVFSLSNLQEGDGYSITNKTVSGFDIAFTNNGSAVQRVMSGMAVSYGELQT